MSTTTRIHGLLNKVVIILREYSQEKIDVKSILCKGLLFSIYITYFG